MSVKNKKRIISIASYLIILAVGLCIFIKPVTNAKDDNTKQVEMVKSIMGGIGVTINEAMGFSTDTEGAVLMDGDTIFNKCITIDRTNANVRPITYALKICGGFLILIIALSHLFTNLDRGMEQIEAVYKVLIEILIAGILMINMGTIVDYICDFGLWLIGKIGAASAGQVTTESCETFLEKLVGERTGGFFFHCEANVLLLLPWVISLGVNIAAKLCIYQVALEIGVRKVLLPLAVADIYQEGLRSPGVRYLKKLLACFLKIAICGIVGMIISSITVIDPNNIPDEGVFNSIFAVLAVSLAGIGFMFKGGEVANDVVGA